MQRFAAQAVLKNRGWMPALAAGLVLLAFGTAGYFSSGRPVVPTERVIEVAARSYAFDPPVIRARKGDRLTLRFTSLDVVHGFYLEGYDLDVTIVPMRREVTLRRAGEPDTETAEEVTFTAGKAGVFRYRCSKTCGAMHPFMLGELVVEPNRLRSTSSALALGVLLGASLLVAMTARETRHGQ